MFVWIVNNIAFAFGMLFQFSLKTGENVCQPAPYAYCVPSEVHGVGPHFHLKHLCSRTEETAIAWPHHM